MQSLHENENECRHANNLQKDEHQQEFTMWNLVSNLQLVRDVYKNEIDFLKNICANELSQLFFLWYPHISDHMEEKLKNAVKNSPAHVITTFFNLGLDATTRGTSMDGVISWGRRSNGAISRKKLYDMIQFIVFCTQSVSSSDFNDEEEWMVYYDNNYDILSIL